MTEPYDDIIKRLSHLEAWINSELGPNGKITKSLESLEQNMDGNGTRLGMRTRVMIIWHTYVWLIGLLSAAVAWVARGFVE